MLSASRKFAQTLVAKILFIVLIASFFLWGIGDVLMPSQDPRWAFKVDDTTVSRDAFNDQYQATLRQLSGAFGGAIDPAQARAFGLDRSVLQQMIDRTLLDVGAADLGLAVSDEAVKQVIQADPRFHDSQGRFDVTLFRRILADNGLTEAAYVARVRSTVVRRQLTEAVTAGVTLPPEIVDGIYRYRNETRTARYVHIADAAAEDAVAEPDEPTLRAFHAENPGLFTAPERRAVSAIILRADDLIERVRVSDAALEDLYAERIGSLATPERRTVLQFTVTDAETARAAASRILAGADFARVGAEVSGLPADDLRLTDVTQDQLLPALAEPVFSAPVGTVIGPVQSPLGWHVATVTEVKPGDRPTLDEVRPELRRELAADQAIDVLIGLTEDLQDNLAGGATLEEAAARLDVPLRTIPAVDANGSGGEGEPVADLPPEFVATAFDTPEGSQSRLVESSIDTYFVLRVDDVTPSAVKPFETVREEVQQAWRAREKRRLSQQTAAAIAERMENGARLEAIAAAETLTVRSTQPLTRGDTAQGLPPEFVDRLFETPRGGSFRVPDGTGILVAEVAAVEVADPAANAQARQEVRESLADAARQDTMTQLAEGLRQRYSVEINPQLLQTLN